MELQDYLRIWRKNWILIVVTTLVITALSAAWSLTRTPEYQAQTRLYVSVRTGEASIGDLQQGTTYARQAVTSYVDIVSTSIVMDKVSEEIGDVLTPAQLSSRVSASSPSNTVLIDISVTDDDPSLAAEIANTTAAVFSDVVTNQLEKPSEGSPARVQIDVVQPAKVPSSPVSPNVTRNLALGFLLGLMLGLAAAVLRTVLDVRVNSKSDVAQITDLPVLGRIIRDPKVATRPLTVQDNPGGPRAEAFRQLRTNLQFLRVEGNPHSFVITSAGAGEGKSTTAANLAIALAETSVSVCLVDGDLRKPRIAELFGIEGGVGLTDVIIGRANLGDAVQKWGRDRLFILPSGRHAPNPSELLGSKEMATLLNELTSSFDYVIVDAPPVLLVTDAALVSKSVGGALMVVAAGKTRKPEFEAALGTLHTIDARMLGIILTMVPEKGPDSYGYSTYSYGEAHDEPLPLDPSANVSRWKAVSATDPSSPDDGDGGSRPILGN